MPLKIDQKPLVCPEFIQPSKGQENTEIFARFVVGAILGGSLAIATKGLSLGTAAFLPSTKKWNQWSSGEKCSAVFATAALLATGIALSVLNPPAGMLFFLSFGISGALVGGVHAIRWGTSIEEKRLATLQGNLLLLEKQLEKGAKTGPKLYDNLRALKKKIFHHNSLIAGENRALIDKCLGYHR